MASKKKLEAELDQRTAVIGEIYEKERNCVAEMKWKRKELLPPNDRKLKEVWTEKLKPLVDFFGNMKGTQLMRDG